MAAPSSPTKYISRPLRPPPSPITLPIFLTNVYFDKLPLPRMLEDIDPRRTPSPPPAHRRAPTPAPPAPTPAPPAPAPAPAPAPTPAPPRAPTPGPSRRQPSAESRESSLSPSEGSDSGSQSSQKIVRPSGAKVQTVKALFKDVYPDLTEADQSKKYTDFRSRLDTLCAVHLSAGTPLSFQHQEDRDKVNDKMIAEYPWLAQYQNYWPVGVCLQGKLHNSAARAVEKSARKTIQLITATAPTRATSKTPKRNALNKN
ncbi:hypothetical protein C8F04DRAFT_1180611 [Mycena alexandri]|uniref:Uncharacterized protein n=1 Tax=Mycena alexandri TaxID=1745969 RepID=A0AAD6WZY2_9AGAR|nr:hypothetical protein C8F04DRAFT_1267348 [Mycena alexandri]KAJ7037197.1 hypothetical protein C8F04DRAFT_1180611 [Mycena alexandri]